MCCYLYGYPEYHTNHAPYWYYFSSITSVNGQPEPWWSKWARTVGSHVKIVRWKTPHKPLHAYSQFLCCSQCSPSSQYPLTISAELCPLMLKWHKFNWSLSLWTKITIVSMYHFLSILSQIDHWGYTGTNSTKHWIFIKYYKLYLTEVCSRLKDVLYCFQTTNAGLLLPKQLSCIFFSFYW